MPKYKLQNNRKQEVCFLGFDFTVDDRVLFPRQKTELTTLVAINRIRQLLSNRDQPLKVVDVGTGSGLIIITIGKIFSNSLIDLYATDVSTHALEVAKLNAFQHNLIDKIVFLQCDLINCLPINPDLIVANLPYTPKNARHRGRPTEPAIAVFDEGDGMAITVRLLHQMQQQAMVPLALILETSPSHVEKLLKSVYKIIQTSPINASFHYDQSGVKRVVEFLW